MNLENAIILAVEGHRGQIRMNGSPYILHPLRVMAKMTTPDAMIVAVLHDIIEDTPHDIGELSQMGYGLEILQAIYLLTRRKAVSYDEYIEDIKLSRLSWVVKIADLQDNMRRDEIPESELQNPRIHKRMAKYDRALEFLQI